MRISYLGNFEPPHSTENHVARSLEALGHEVTRLQEGEVPALEVCERSRGHDLFLWTMTQGLAEKSGTREQRALMLADVGRHMTTVGFHLDRWWGLEREHLVREEPFFRVDRLFTADGGHDERWRELGIRHSWLPPAVYHAEAIDVEPSHRDLDVVFVGAWRDYGHAGWWPYRHELLVRLRARYGRRFTCWPKNEAVRGLELNALLSSAKVVIGDSCLVGAPARYWSDRVPETMGRGGFLVHPEVEGLREAHPHLPTWQLGNWEQLFALVDYHLAFPDEREELRREQARHTRELHTYRERLKTLLERL